jgi:SWI/SNF-related matrix-associated actin-dependent regulator of chromatin subfamily A-like protein 1
LLSSSTLLMTNAYQPQVFPVGELCSIQAEIKNGSSTDDISHWAPMEDDREEYIAVIAENSRATRLQKEGVRFILSHDGRCLVADEMGVGKTLQALLAMWFYKEEFPLLVVCPCTLRGVWKSEAEKWLSGFGLDVSRHLQIIASGSDVLKVGKLIYVVSYNLLARESGFRRLPEGPFECVIVDDSHFIKSDASKRTAAVLEVARSSRRCILLSGTPAPNNPDELFTQLNAIFLYAGDRWEDSGSST